MKTVTIRSTKNSIIFSYKGQEDELFFSNDIEKFRLIYTYTPSSARIICYEPDITIFTALLAAYRKRGITIEKIISEDKNITYLVYMFRMIEVTGDVGALDNLCTYMREGV